MITLIHIYQQLRVASPPIGMFWEVRGNWRMRRKPSWTQKERVNQGPWSCEEATHTVPLCQPIKYNLEEKPFLYTSTPHSKFVRCAALTSKISFMSFHSLAFSNRFIVVRVTMDQSQSQQLIHISEFL